MPQDVTLMFLWFMLPVREVLYSYLASSCEEGANCYFFVFVVILLYSARGARSRDREEHARTSSNFFKTSACNAGYNLGQNKWKL